MEPSLRLFYQLGRWYTDTSRIHMFALGELAACEFWV